MEFTPHVQWTIPTPAWSAFANNADQVFPLRFEQPMLLRFASDDFMENLMKLLAEEPSRLVDYMAKPEVWSGTENESNPLKLYQVAHQRHYLVAMNLVCRVPGFPDRVLSRSKGEKVSFVIRRLKGSHSDLRTPSPENLEYFNEYAFVQDGEQQAWKEIGATTNIVTKKLVRDEFQYPLIGINYQENPDFKRRMLTGTIPVGKAETFLGTKIIPAQTAGNPEDETQEGGDLPNITNDPRLAYLYQQVIAPWRRMMNEKDKNDIEITDIADRLDLEPDSENADSTPSMRQEQMTFWYILLDLADFIDANMIKDKVFDQFSGMGNQAGIFLRNSLTNIQNFRLKLEGATLAFEPDIGSILTYDDPVEGISQAYYANIIDDNEIEVLKSDSWPDEIDLNDIKSLIEPQVNHEGLLLSIIADALRDTSIQKKAPSLPFAAEQAAQANKTNFEKEVWFIIRCVFERPQCTGQSQEIISESTVPFQIALFFDPDAPSRPVRITLPFDTSPAGLRKFSKNTAFILSDVLACQLGQIQEYRLVDLVLSVLPWPLNIPLRKPRESCRDLSTADGLVLSLSIPIVTICALLLLLIIAQLLDSFYHWMPYLITCFKLPGIKGKEKSS